VELEDGQMDMAGEERDRALFAVGRANFWFPLSPDMTRDITCNDTAAKDGISVYYKSADSQVDTTGTTTALPISGFCAKLPSKAPGT
jgi:hypothetical protein